MDELLLLSEMLADKQRMHFKMLAAVQGHNIDDAPDDEEGLDDLPEELLAMERELKRQRAEKAAKEEAEGTAKPNSPFPEGLGYEVE